VAAGEQVLPEHLLSVLLNNLALQAPHLVGALGPEKRLVLDLWRGNLGSALSTTIEHGLATADLVSMSAGLAGEAAWNSLSAIDLLNSPLN
jgi:hypothetical protein